jgi:hypothetical protein
MLGTEDDDETGRILEERRLAKEAAIEAEAASKKEQEVF